jgi:ABC-2 type transport system permease protein
MGRYGTLLWIQLRASLLVAMQYRLEFFVESATALFWSATTFVPLFVVYDRRAQVGGWSFGESLLVLAFFLLLKSLIEGAVTPSLLRVVEQVRKGTLDFVLLKPADAQFLVSTAKFDPSAVSGTLGAAGLFAWAYRELGEGPSPGGVLVAGVLLAAAVALLYAGLLFVVSAAFAVVKVDNLAYLFTSVFDAARWPVSVFKGALGLFFTFVVPLGLMTTWPAAALLGRLDAPMALASLAVTALFAVAARRTWHGALARYTSASS